MEILTGRQMRRVDRRAIRDLGIPSLELMEAAGRGIAAAMRTDIPDLARRGVAIVCGKGNNGGDGLVLARHLWARGLAPRVVLLAQVSDLTGDPSENARRAAAAGVRILEAPDEAAWCRAREVLLGRDLLVDALLGTGVKGGARGLVAQAIDDLQTLGAEIVSVDLPSGVDADGGEVEGPAIRAQRTYTLCRPKVALVVEPAASYAGTWRVVEIGIPDECVSAEKVGLEWLDEAAAPAIPRRPRHAHKGDFGHLLIAAGSRGKSGAAVLASRAALRSGVGLVTVVTPRSSLPVVAAQQAEVMTAAASETRDGGFSKSAAAGILSLAGERDAMAVGPGIGNEPDTRSMVKAVVSKRRLPCVLDADGLNALSEAGGRTTRLRAGEQALILTPHPGEAARLLGVSSEAIQRDRLGSARRLAEITGAVVVLKGHHTLVAESHGRVSVNGSGSPGMATAGTGDVLTGVVGALLARGLPSWEAARLGVFVHGQAGEMAALRVGEEGMTASDVVGCLPDAMAARVAPEL